MSVFRVGDRVAYDQGNGRYDLGTVEKVVTHGLEVGYRVTWDDGYKDEEDDYYTDAELKSAEDVV